ncbi:MAG: hypothetical protein L0H70_04800 [Xanthomonadales bacterium]|nr:hypothetical protein [Xanthomonadales bacterium]
MRKRTLRISVQAELLVVDEPVILFERKYAASGRAANPSSPQQAVG